ncbi:MAG: HAD hydrolase-like protein [Okeania sp. SIO2D1]|nr:HAD hydrolase-like protein [Okeania sp. SIO2D1]
MYIHTPKILALDFDGVICNGLIEYFQTTCKAYEQVWQSQEEVSEDLADSFYRLRPVIETGWEMPVLIRALLLGISEEKILADWSNVSREIVNSEQLNPQELAQAVDGVRDRWIKTNGQEWLSLHRFYPGVLIRIQKALAADVEVFIITTKEGRFVKKLLKQQGVRIEEGHIIGKEVQLPKYESLRKLIAEFKVKEEQLWFVEDRLKTLDKVSQQPDLDGVQLFLAGWGYNTERSRQSIQDNSRVNLLSLSQFSQSFSKWF